MTPKGMKSNSVFGDAGRIHRIEVNGQYQIVLVLIS